MLSVVMLSFVSPKSLSHVAHEDGGDEQWRFRISEEVEESVEVELLANLSVNVVKLTNEEAK
jgi:hypothetical protein